QGYRSRNGCFVCCWSHTNLVRFGTWATTVVVMTDMRAAVAIAAALAACAALPAAPVARADASAGVPAGARAQLLAMALRVAAADGDAHPHAIRAVQTTIGRADRATHCECATVVPPPSTPIYLLAMRGRFSCNRCSHPPGRRIGPGTVITLEAPIATPSRYS